jgi:hypothetical protein
MRALQIIGGLCIAIGLLIIIHPPSYSRQETVFKVGTLEATMRVQHPLPAWVGGAALGGGVVLIVLGWLRR